MNKLALLAAAALMLPAHLAARTAPSPKLEASASSAVVDTRDGRVQGFTRDGIQTYRGLPYATAERFEAPSKPAAWKGTRMALTYGPICPQPVNPNPPEPQAFLSDWKFRPQSENCQSLNVWTPKADAKKRPVMVWLHGGGFSSGSSIELPSYDGTNLAAKGDVVVVSVNHRLNALGFMDLSAYGEQYKASGNVGMTDIVVALEWIRDNIAAFGGDPANVTIFGQSGGGGKVTTLLAAPSAKGLFAKAIVMSGAFGGPDSRVIDQKLSRRVASLTFKNAGLADGDIAGIRKISYEALTAASGKALHQVSDETAPAGAPRAMLDFPRVDWGPVFDHAFLPAKPFDGNAPAISAGVPLLIGSTLNEFNLINPRLKDRRKWTAEQTTAYIRETWGDRADAVTAAFRQAYPKLPLSEIGSIDAFARISTLDLARQKAAQPGAPVYNYIFARQSPVLDYVWGAGHTNDVAYAFNNAAAGVQSNGGGAEVDKLTALMSQAWINFARTGNPNAKGLPVWPAFTAASPATIVFDAQSWVGTGHDAELLAQLTRPPARK